MRLRKIFHYVSLYFVSLFLFSCNNIEKKNVNCNATYPLIIFETKLFKDYDFAKWIVYCSNYKQNKIICYDEKIKSEIYIRNSPIYNDVVLEDLKVSGDTSLFKFSFYVYDTCKCILRPYLYINTVVFIKTQEYKIYRFNTKYDGKFDLNLPAIISFYYSDTIKEALNTLYPYLSVEEEFLNFLDSLRNEVKINSWILEYYDNKKYLEYNKFVMW